jgi:hypothetical protein
MALCPRRASATSVPASPRSKARGEKRSVASTPNLLLVWLSVGLPVARSIRLRIRETPDTGRHVFARMNEVAKKKHVSGTVATSETANSANQPT